MLSDAVTDALDEFIVSKDQITCSGNGNDDSIINTVATIVNTVATNISEPAVPVEEHNIMNTNIVVKDTTANAESCIPA